MKSKDIHNSRIQIINDLDLRRGAFVLYWMQQSQRAEYNHALEYAVQQANEMGQGVVVVFGLMDDYPEANLRHYTFMLEGLQETQAALSRRGIKMVVQKGNPADVAISAGRRASLMSINNRVILCHAWRAQAKGHQRKVERRDTPQISS